MSKLFINTITQHGGKLSKNDEITILNSISKHINKKFKILEYTCGIKIKLEPLQQDNSIGLPTNIIVSTTAQINGPIKGTIPINTAIPFSIPTPTIIPVTTGVSINPFGSVLGVPALAINPYDNYSLGNYSSGNYSSGNYSLGNYSSGNYSSGNYSSIEDKIKKAKKYFDIYLSISSQFEDFNIGKIKKDEIDTTYFDFVDLEDPGPIDGLEKLIDKDGLKKLIDSYSKL